MIQTILISVAINTAFSLFIIKRIERKWGFSKQYIADALLDLIINTDWSEDSDEDEPEEEQK